MRATMTNGWAKPMTTIAAACTAGMLAVAGCNKVPPMTEAQRAAVAEADPQMQAVLTQLGKDGGKSIATLTVDQARSGPAAQMAAMEIAKSQGKTVPEPVGGVSKRSMPGPDGNNVTLQVYTPMESGPFPTLVYYHGGGWVIGSVLAANPYDGSCRRLCNLAHCVVVEVDYRLAPENPYPAAVNDCYAAFRYVVANPDKFKSNGKVAVGGESAGGNLAVAVPLMAIDKHAVLPNSILSIYPVGGSQVDTPSARENASAIPLDTPSLSWFYTRYVPHAAERSARYFDIVNADLHGLPPTTVITDQIDPLNSDGRTLADKLKADGVQTRFMNYDGVTHEFFGMGQVVDKAQEAEQYAVEGLMMGFGTTDGTMGNMPGM